MTDGLNFDGKKNGSILGDIITFVSENRERQKNEREGEGKRESQKGSMALRIRNSFICQIMVNSIFYYLRKCVQVT